MDFASYSMTYVLEFIKLFFSSFQGFSLFVFIFFVIAMFFTFIKYIINRR